MDKIYRRYLPLAVLLALLLAGGLPCLAEEEAAGPEPAVQSEQASQAEQVEPGEEDLRLPQKKVLKPEAGEVFLNIGEVQVQEEAQARRKVDLPGSVDIIGEDFIRKEVTNNALDLLRRVPGFTFLDYGNGGVPNGFMMRGFAANHGSDVLVNVDGIPINDHQWQEDGAPDFNQIGTDEIEWIEVIKGPLDARYGNWARAGVVNLYTRTRGDFFKANLTGGSWNYKKGYVTWGNELFDHKFNQVYSVEGFSTDGWRENSDQERQNIYGKWYYRPWANLQFGAQLHVYRADWSTGAYINEDKWQADPRQAFSGSEDDGGYRNLTEGSLHIDGTVAPNVPLQVRLWYKENSASRWADWTYDGSGQTETHTDESVIGLISRLGYERRFSEQNRLSLEGGFDYRHFASNNENWDTDNRSRTGINSDNDMTFDNAGVYLKANWDPIEYVRLFGGLRHDFFSGDFEDDLTGEQKDMDDIGVTTYKAGIIGNITKDYSVYASVATTFELPNGTLKYMADPEVSDLLFYEAGLKAQPLEWLLLRYAYFWSQDDAVQFVDGQFESLGQAVRSGHELEATLTPFENLTLFSALTLHDCTFDGGPNDGHNVPAVPDYIFKLGLIYDAPWGTGARLWYNNVGQWDTDPANTHSYGGYNTADLAIYQRIGKRWAVLFDVKNIFDERYSEFVGFWSGSNQYMPSNPRAYYLSLRYDLI